MSEISKEILKMFPKEFAIEVGAVNEERKVYGPNFYFIVESMRDGFIPKTHAPAYFAYAQMRNLENNITSFIPTKAFMGICRAFYVLSGGAIQDATNGSKHFANYYAECHKYLRKHGMAKSKKVMLNGNERTTYDLQCTPHIGCVGESAEKGVKADVMKWSQYDCTEDSETQTSRIGE